MDLNELVNILEVWYNWSKRQAITSFVKGKDTCVCAPHRLCEKFNASGQHFCNKSFEQQ